MARLNLVVIRSRDLDKSEKFYNAIGLEFNRHSHGKQGVIHLANESEELVFEIYPMESNFEANTRLGFHVKDITQIYESLTSLGYKFSTPKLGEFGVRSVGVDPDGYKVELTGSSPIFGYKQQIAVYTSQDGKIFFETEIDTAIYKGPISIGADKEYICSDLYVFHRTTKEPVYENDDFKEAVIRALIKENLIPDNEYELTRSELGMQDDNCAVFEGLSLLDDDKDLLEEILNKCGCTKVDDDNEDESLYKHC